MRNTMGNDLNKRLKVTSISYLRHLPEGESHNKITFISNDAQVSNYI